MPTTSAEGGGEKLPLIFNIECDDKSLHGKVAMNVGVVLWCACDMLLFVGRDIILKFHPSQPPSNQPDGNQGANASAGKCLWILGVGCGR